MKTPLLLTLAALAFTGVLRADSPDAILKDYRKAATAALEKLNATLETTTVPIIAELVKAGDTTGAEAVQAQLKAKIEGEPLLQAHPKAAKLFTQYDAARLKALEPAQKSAVHRIESLLSGPEGKKLETVNSLASVRAEIESAIPKVENLPTQWAYSKVPNGFVYGTFTLNTDGTAELKGTSNHTGKWKFLKKANTLSILCKFPEDTWTIILSDNKLQAEIHSTVWADTRHLKALPTTAGK